MKADMSGGDGAVLCIGINDFPNSSRVDVEAAMPILRRAGAPLLAHAELVTPIEVKVRCSALPLILLRQHRIMRRMSGLSISSPCSKCSGHLVWCRVNDQRH